MNKIATICCKQILKIFLFKWPLCLSIIAGIIILTTKKSRGHSGRQPAMTHAGAITTYMTGYPAATAVLYPFGGCCARGNSLDDESLRASCRSNYACTTLFCCIQQREEHHREIESRGASACATMTHTFIGYVCRRTFIEMNRTTWIWRNEL